MYHIDCFQALIPNHLNPNVCNWVTPFMVMPFAVAIGLVLALTIDRYRTVCRPISYHNSRNSGLQKWIVLAFWMFGIVVGSSILGWPNENIASCRLTDVLGFTSMFLMFFCIFGAAVVIIILYGLIYRCATKQVS